MEKVVLLCLLVGAIGLLAEMSPLLRRSRPLDLNPRRPRHSNGDLTAYGLMMSPKRRSSAHNSHSRKVPFLDHKVMMKTRPD